MPLETRFSSESFAFVIHFVSSSLSRIEKFCSHDDSISVTANVSCFHDGQELAIKKNQKTKVKRRKYKSRRENDEQRFNNSTGC